jgi:hypothetical protein
MFNCERCGSSFSPIRMAAAENCPRCRARDGISTPLTFKAFQLPDMTLTDTQMNSECPGPLGSSTSADGQRLSS